MSGLELLDSREVMLGSTPVARLLPKRQHRTVGPWCFADHFGPVDVGVGAMAVGPHPHIGLQTVTWLFAGEVVHTDSLGSEQVIRPGQLNLMSAGRGIAHAEQSPAASVGLMHGLQLWVAQPDATRWSDPAFEHHAELPVVDLSGAAVTVLVGSLAGETSAARTDWPMVGLDLIVGTSVEVPLEPSFEHAVLVMSGAPSIDGTTVSVGTTAYLAPGSTSVRIDGSARVVVIGGEPFEAPIAMSWNFVARTRDELDDAHRDWAGVIAHGGSQRFGDVRSELGVVPAPGYPTGG